MQNTFHKKKIEIVKNEIGDKYVGVDKQRGGSNLNY